MEKYNIELRITIKAEDSNEAQNIRNQYEKLVETQPEVLNFNGSSLERK